MSVFENNNHRIIYATEKIVDDTRDTEELFNTYLTKCLLFYASIVNKAKEQGVEDKDISDFMEYFMENEMTDTHIALVAQNYIESKKD